MLSTATDRGASTPIMLPAAAASSSERGKATSCSFAVSCLAALKVASRHPQHQSGNTHAVAQIALATHSVVRGQDDWIARVQWHRQAIASAQL